MNGKMKSCVKGLMMGCCGTPRPLSTAKKEPVAWLYNGVRLPKLPEWDKETYPYAVLVEHNSATPYWLAVSTTAFVNNLGLCQVKGDCRVFPFKNDVWGEIETFSGLSIPLPFWTNTDFLNRDGTLYLAASEPIPVYE